MIDFLSKVILKFLVSQKEICYRFLSPITLLIKLLIKQLWTLSLDWNEIVLMNFHQARLNIQNELKILEHYIQ